MIFLFQSNSTALVSNYQTSLLSFEWCGCPSGPIINRDDYNFSSIGVYASGPLNS